MESCTSMRQDFKEHRRKKREGDWAVDRRPQLHHRGRMHPQRMPATMEVGSGPQIGVPRPLIGRDLKLEIPVNSGG
ncbi:hypothetical protein CRG98_036277 [Punica granatum]|uniref:Uncharacterized protein n=1 Tax=Punica granatum TaxID=22663 RepID=A0A2I0IH14_PUNGR|nr:hypothetical protein CRG98_036277 [Punica granatum]